MEVDLGKVSEETQNRIVKDLDAKTAAYKLATALNKSEIAPPEGASTWTRTLVFKVYEHAAGRTAPMQRKRRLATWTEPRSYAVHDLNSIANAV